MSKRQIRFLVGIAAIAAGVYYVYQFWGAPVDVVLASLSIVIGIVLLGTTWKRP